MKQEEIDRIVNALRPVINSCLVHSHRSIPDELIKEALRTIPDPPQIKLKEVERLVKLASLDHNPEQLPNGIKLNELGKTNAEQWRSRIGYTLADLKQEGGEG